MGKLSNLRKKCNLSQRQLADLIGVSRATYQRYEKDDVIINIDALKLASEVLGVTVEFLTEMDSGNGNKHRDAIRADINENNFLDKEIGKKLYIKSRIEFICETIAEPYFNQDEEEFMKLLQRDLPRYRVREIMVWDTMARTFLKYCKMKKVKEESKEELAIFLLTMTMEGEPVLERYKDMYDVQLVAKTYKQTKLIVISDYKKNIGEDIKKDWYV